MLPKPEPFSPPRLPQEAERWGAKHVPSTAAELVVAKKKVTEVMQWLESCRDGSDGQMRGRGQAPCRTLLLTGAVH